jgi:Fe-Mn family superoxide dismutase
LHEAYFEGLGGGGTPHGALAAVTARDSGSTDRWWTEFATTGKAEGGGSDFVVLAYSPRDIRLIKQRAADRTTTLAGERPMRMPITWISTTRPHPTSKPLCKRSAGTMR